MQKKPLIPLIKLDKPYQLKYRQKIEIFYCNIIVSAPEISSESLTVHTSASTTRAREFEHLERAIPSRKV